MPEIEGSHMTGLTAQICSARHIQSLYAKEGDKTTSYTLP